MKHRQFIIPLLLVVLICAALTIYSHTRQDGRTAKIYVDNKLYKEVSLVDVTAPYEITIENGSRKNIVLIENGRALMKYSDCPDKLCVKQGGTSSSSVPIVCLPNRVVVVVEGNKDKYEKPDAISR